MPRHSKRAKLSKPGKGKTAGAIPEESSSPFSGSEEEMKDTEKLIKKGKGKTEKSLHTKDL